MAETPSELSYPVAIDRIGPAWQSHRLVASDAERAALAARFDLLELKEFQAELRVRRVRAGRYVELDGTLRAQVVQSCVVSLEPVEAGLEEHVRELYGPIGGAPDDAAAEILVDPDSPEPIDGPTIDIGEAAAQHFGLSLDPYPRAAAAGDRPEAEPSEAEPTEPQRPSPFAALGALKPRQ